MIEIIYDVDPISAALVFGSDLYSLNFLARNYYCG